MQLEITAMQLGGCEVSVPPGLSEVVNRAGVWSPYREQQIKDYDREVIRRNGKLFTILTKRGAAQC